MRHGEAASVAHRQNKKRPVERALRARIGRVHVARLEGESEVQQPMTTCKHEEAGTCFADVWEKFENGSLAGVQAMTHAHGIRTIARMFYFHGTLHAKQGHAIKTVEDLAHEEAFCKRLREEAGCYRY